MGAGRLTRRGATLKKFWLLLAIVVGLAIYLESDRYGIRLGSAVFRLDGDRHDLDTKTHRFLTDIQFKNFDHAATFHTEEEREQFDIAAMIEKKFLVKPEQLDIRHFEVLRIDISPEGDRGKSVVKANVKLLALGQTKDVEAIFYWKKVGGTWHMALQSSL